MTRINLVNVEDLADQHLFAEWREIKMVPAALARSINAQDINRVYTHIPSRYTMNTGHVLFFYDKMKFLRDRYLLLTEELKNRNYDIAEHDPDKIFIEGKDRLFTYSEWQPSVDEIKINIDRIVQRLNEKPTWYRYYGKVQSPKYFEELYNLMLTHRILLNKNV